MVLGLIYGFGYSLGTQFFSIIMIIILMFLMVKERFFYFLSLCGMT
jgi:hypothetical protein